MTDVPSQGGGPEATVPAAPAAAGDAPRAVERSPVDVLRLAVGVGLLTLVLLFGWVFGDAAIGFLSDLLRGVEALPTWFDTAVLFATRVLAVVVILGGLVAALATRRFRLLGTVVLAGLLAVGIYALVDEVVRAEEASLVDLPEIHDRITEEDFPTAAGLAQTAAIVTAAAPWLTRRWRRLAWTLVVLSTLSRFLTAPLSFDSLVALLSGWASGSAALVLLGAPVRRPTLDQVRAGLRAVGVPLAELAQAGVDARGSTPYFGTTDGGDRLFVKALGADERSADVLFRAWRRVLPHDLGDEKAFSSLRRTVEHEALVSLMARDLGVRTPRVVGFAHVEPDAYVLAYEAIDGDSLDRVEPRDLTDEVLQGIWALVAELRHHRIAHRDLRLANVFLAGDGQVWLIDFGFSELAASDLLLANDLAELVASLSLAVGPERALAAARAVVPDRELAAAADRLRPFALSGATRTGMKAQGGLLDGLRRDVAALAPPSG